MSKMLTIHPYLIGKVWVFDDPGTGLKEEAFVLGMSEMITRVIETRGIPEAGSGFDLQFSDSPFDGFDAMVVRDTSEDGGTWYEGEVLGLPMRGWLCPALFLYFETAPERIYMAARALSPGVNPVWTPLGSRIRQFFSP